MIANPNVDHVTQKVLGVVSRALSVFGGDVTPTQPPSFAADRHLEDDLGRGFFGSSEAAQLSGALEPTSRRTAGELEDGEDGDDDAGERLGNDVADRLVTGGAWTWADAGHGGPR